MFLLFQELVARVRAEATSIIDHWWSLTLKKKETKNEKHGVNDDVKNCSQKHRLLVVCSTKKKKLQWSNVAGKLPNSLMVFLSYK